MRRYAAILRPLIRRQQPQQMSRHISALTSSLKIPSSPLILSPTSMSFCSCSDDDCYESSASQLAASAAAYYATLPPPTDIPSNMILVNSVGQLMACRQNIRETKTPSILYFSARWSRTCKCLWPDLKKFCESNPDIQFYNADMDAVWDCGFLGSSKEFYVDGAPTFYFYKDGEAIHWFSGNGLEEIQEYASLICQNSPTV